MTHGFRSPWTNPRVRLTPLLALLLGFCACGTNAPESARPQLDRVKLPSGFAINLYTGNVAGARSMALGDHGTVFVGSWLPGRVYAVLDRHGSKRAEEVIVLARGLDRPIGVAFRDGALYVAETRRVLRYDNIETRLKNPPIPVVVSDHFPNPDEREHAVKYIRFGPDGMLYVSVGAPCDICEPNDERFGTIMRMKVDGSGLEIYARGVRNSVGCDWNRVTNDLWFTDNGQDLVGQNIPGDELNRAPVKGLNFGFPHCHGKSIPDAVFAKERNCREFVPPVIELGPHVAALGMRFYTGKMFPSEYWNQIFIAEHGSSNRTIPIGYRVTLVTLEGNTPTKYKAFAEGWLQSGHAWGRPVDLLVMPDGALLVSDDRAGAIYRISYQK